MHHRLHTGPTVGRETPPPRLWGFHPSEQQMTTRRTGFDTAPCGTAPSDDMARTALLLLFAVAFAGCGGSAPAEQAACDRALDVVSQDLTDTELTAAWDEVARDAADTAVEDEARQAAADTVEAPDDPTGYPLQARRFMEACVDAGALARNESG